jgi:hypothetical protein
MRDGGLKAARSFRGVAVLTQPNRAKMEHLIRGLQRKVFSMKDSPANWSLLDSASRWVRNTLAKRADEVALLDSEERERIACDLNLSVSELQMLCARDGRMTNLLQKRMSQFHLDKNEIKRVHPAVVRDLEKVCALCESDAKCSRDFNRGTASAGVSEYCPNTPTLQELQREQSSRSAA